MDTLKNEADFLSLYDKYYERIYSFVYRNILHTETAEDITAEIFTDALAYIKKHKTVISNFSAWIYRITSNKLSKYYRQNDRNVDSLDVVLENIVPDQRDRVIDEIESLILLKSALKKLKIKDSLVIEMYYLMDMNYSEISKKLGIKEVTIRSKVSRTIKKLEKIIKGNGYER